VSLYSCLTAINVSIQPSATIFKVEGTLQWRWKQQDSQKRLQLYVKLNRITSHNNGIFNEFLVIHSCKQEIIPWLSFQCNGDYGISRCDAVYSGRMLSTFRKNVLLPISVLYIPSNRQLVVRKTTRCYISLDNNFYKYCSEKRNSRVSDQSWVRSQTRSFSFHQLLHNHLSSGAGTIGPTMSVLPSVHGLTMPHE
jgi:hypothetical protein